MNLIRPGILVLAAAALAAFPAASPAQTSGPATDLPAAVPAEADEWLEEIQQIHVRLSELQARALEDPELSARRDSLGIHIKIAMEAIDPTLLNSMSRIEEMERQAAEAEAQSNDAKLTELRVEAQQIEEQFFAAQQQALQRPDLAARVSAFQTLLEQKIIAADPEAPDLLARFQELEARLSELTEGEQ